jgi:protein-S-isoprenylcysteine O-methyltransferase Ste14
VVRRAWCVGVILALIRALTYAALFIGAFLVFIPGRILARVGISPVTTIGLPEVAGLLIVALGLALALTCVLTFALLGRGTPAPFDPPRALVIAGPYRYVRNPMYIGAATALLGAALYYRSFALAGYALVFLLITHLFVLLYEEPHLRHVFGQPYQDYLRTVHRWVPTWRS